MSLDNEVRRIVAEEVRRVLVPTLAEIKQVGAVLASRAGGPDEVATPLLLEVGVAAKLMRVRPATIRRWMAKGRLTPYGTARARRVSQRELLAMRPAGHATETSGSGDQQIAVRTKEILQKFQGA